MMNGKFRLLLVFIGLSGCVAETQPKPRAYLGLRFDKAQYSQQQLPLPFSFDMNTAMAQTAIMGKTAMKIVYPQMKASLYVNYTPVTNNLDSLLNDAYQLPSKHIIKAEEIPERLFINPDRRVFGTLFSVVGNAASQHQFFLTDSVHHFLIGSLYFYARPNYDSIYPAVAYIEKDLIHFIETFRWKK